jgi:hypothetical protein
MSRLPTVLASSVIRGSSLGESHGGLYLVDLERGSAELKLDWNTTDIDVSGRGGDRGLRGIAFYDERIWVAANAQLIVLDQDFKVLESFTNPYLQHVHEISLSEHRLFVAATGFDSVLTFDLKAKAFIDGWHLGSVNNSLSLSRYDPLSTQGPAAAHDFHINSVTASGGSVWFSGLNTPGLLHANGQRFGLVAPLPQGTHNAQVLSDGVLYNDTAADRVCYRHGGVTTEVGVPEFARQDILNADRFSSSLARPGFARGLCALDEGLVAGGSSPSTISVYDMQAGQRITQVNLSMDVRNAVHGLALWPYSKPYFARQRR